MKKSIILFLSLFLLTACTEMNYENLSDEEALAETQNVKEVVKDANDAVDEQKISEVKETIVDEYVGTENANISYWVNFLNCDGSVLQRSIYALGETPKYYGDTPTYTDGFFVYTFIGWDKSFTPVTMTQTYTAIYSKIAITANISTSIVVNPVGKTGLKYDGTAQELVVAGSGATFTYSLDGGAYSTAVPTATNAGIYSIEYKKDDIVVETLEVTIAKATPSVSDFTFNRPDYAINNPNVALTTTNVELGEITIKYAADVSPNTWSSDMSTDAGTFCVKAVVAESENYNSAEVTSDDWKFTILTLNIRNQENTADITIKYVDGMNWDEYSKSTLNTISACPTTGYSFMISSYSHIGVGGLDVLPTDVINDSLTYQFFHAPLC